MPSTPTTETVRPEVLFDAFTHPQRRQVLTHLRERHDRGETVIELEALASGNGLDDAAVALHHRHLPKLDAAGFVDWDREARIVRPGPRFPAVASFLELMDEHGDDVPVAWP